MRFAAPSSQIVEEFASTLRARGFRTLLRTTKGRDIMAACGQLGKKQRYQLDGVRINVPIDMQMGL